MVSYIIARKKLVKPEIYFEASNTSVEYKHSGEPAESSFRKSIPPSRGLHGSKVVQKAQGLGCILAGNMKLAASQWLADFNRVATSTGPDP